MITATRPATKEDIPYPTVNQVETQIFQSEQKLQLILIKEKNLGATRQALLKLPETEENNKQLNELKIEIVSTVNQKNLTEERLTVLKTHLPEVLEEAKQNESILNAKKEEVEKLKNELIKTNKKLTQALKIPITLIQQRKQTIQDIQQAGYKISTLTSALHWHPPKPEVLPGEPEAFEALRDLFPPRVVRWRGK